MRKRKSENKTRNWSEVVEVAALLVTVLINTLKYLNYLPFIVIIYNYSEVFFKCKWVTHTSPKGSLAFKGCMQRTLALVALESVYL